MTKETPRFNLKTYDQGDENWSHTDTVEALDSLAVDRGPITDRPSEGEYDDELYAAVDQRIIWRWDSNDSDWKVFAGLGSGDSPIPETSYFETVRLNEVEFSDVIEIKTELGEVVGRNPETCDKIPLPFEEISTRNLNVGGAKHLEHIENIDKSNVTDFTRNITVNGGEYLLLKISRLSASSSPQSKICLEWEGQDDGSYITGFKNGAESSGDDHWILTTGDQRSRMRGWVMLSHQSRPTLGTFGFLPGDPGDTNQWIDYGLNTDPTSSVSNLRIFAINEETDELEDEGIQNIQLSIYRADFFGTIPEREATINGWKHTHHYDEVEAVTFGNRVFSAGRENEVIAAGISDGQKHWEHTHHPTSMIRDVFVIDDIVLNCGTGDTVLAADAADGSYLWDHSHHGDAVYEVSAGSDRAYSGDRSGYVVAADLSNGGKVWEHAHHSQEDMIRTVHYDEFDNVVLSSGYDNHIIAADAADGSLVWEYDRGRSLKSVDKINELVYAGLWSSTPTAKVEAIDWNTDETIWTHEAHDPDSAGVQEIHANDGYVASAGNDGKVAVANAETGEIIDEHTKHTDAVRSVHVADGFVLSGSRDESVIMHDISQ